VLAVDRDDPGTVLAGGGHDQLAGQHQRLLVGEQQALSGSCGGKRGIQARGADDGGDYGVIPSVAGKSGDCGHAGVGTGGQAGLAQSVAEPGVRGFVGDRGVVGAMPTAGLEQGLDLAAGGQRAGAHGLRVAGDDVERRGADRAGGAEDGDAAHQKPSQILPSANTGRAANTLSRRSMMPPWPGIRLPESLAPTWRLSRLSNRSPTTENSTVSRP